MQSANEALSNCREHRLSRAEGATFLTERGYRIAKTILDELAVIGGASAFEKFGHKPLYTAAGLLARSATRTPSPRRNTSQA